MECSWKYEQAAIIDRKSSHLLPRFPLSGDSTVFSFAIPDEMWSKMSSISSSPPLLIYGGPSLENPCREGMTNHPLMEVIESSSFVPKAPHFFKIMLDEWIQSGKLIIPKKFVRKYGTHLSNSNIVILKIPTSDAWKVELRTGDGSVWLEKGWPEFLNFYSIKHGDFLVFHHETESCSNEFDVVILDKTAVEIEYPVKSHASSQEIKVEDVCEDSVIPDETQDHQPSRRMTMRTSHLQKGSYFTSKCYVPSKASSSCPDDLIGSASQEGKGAPERRKKVKSSNSSQAKTRGPLRGAEKAKALERAKSYKSSNPYFQVVMQPHYVHPSCGLHIPGNFLRKHLGQKESGEMKFHVSGGKVWTVRYRIRVRRHRVDAKVRGWKAFVVDNDLVVGDVCVFELIRALKSVSFKITIFRAPKVPRSNPKLEQGPAPANRLSIPSDLTEKRVLRPCSLHLQDGAAPSKLEVEGCSGAKSNCKEDSFFDMKQAGNTNRIRGVEVEPASSVPKHPCFQVVVGKSHLYHRYMTIPAGFTRKHLNLKHEKQFVTLKIGDRSWLTKLVISSAMSPSFPRAIFATGFSDFAKENSLELEDVCIFELIEEEEMVFRVSITRAKLKEEHKEGRDE